MIVINTSDTIAALIPQIWYSIDPDSPLDTELPHHLRLILRSLFLKTFSLAHTDEEFDNQWIIRLRSDSSFMYLRSNAKFVNIEFVDMDGTFLIELE